jgi:hypothetical protein
MLKLKMDVIEVTEEGRIVLKARQPTGDDAKAFKPGRIDTIMTLHPVSDEEMKNFPAGAIVAVSMELAFDPRK